MAIEKDVTTQQLDDKTKLVMLYFINRLNGVLGKTHLQKLMFLTDLLSTIRSRKQITSFSYTRYHHGPYAEAVDKYADALKDKGWIDVKEFHSQVKYFRYYAAKPLNPQKMAELFTPDELMVLDEVVSSFGNMGLRQVLDLVYTLGENQIKGMPKGQAIDLIDFAKKVRPAQDPADAIEEEL